MSFQFFFRNDCSCWPCLSFSVNVCQHIEASCSLHIWTHIIFLYFCAFIVLECKHEHKCDANSSCCNNLSNHHSSFILKYELREIWIWTCRSCSVPVVHDKGLHLMIYKPLEGTQGCWSLCTAWVYFMTVNAVCYPFTYNLQYVLVFFHTKINNIKHAAYSIYLYTYTYLS